MAIMISFGMIRTSFVNSYTFSLTKIFLPNNLNQSEGDLDQVPESTVQSQITFVHSTWRAGGHQRCMVLILFLLEALTTLTPIASIKKKLENSSFYVLITWQKFRKKETSNNQPFLCTYRSTKEILGSQRPKKESAGMPRVN